MYIYTYIVLCERVCFFFVGVKKITVGIPRTKKKGSDFFSVYYTCSAHVTAGDGGPKGKRETVVVLPRKRRVLPGVLRFFFSLPLSLEIIYTRVYTHTHTYVYIRVYALGGGDQQVYCCVSCGPSTGGGGGGQQVSAARASI